ncbi:PEP-CTERM sorting domain-containing protein [Lyngbya sp. CCY1209]|jgi:hypothetical protein|uniref:PEP-CTERM sorting domain-containing protein n=1 Tax=Lyngbya sp. CCY1209 TaxID=2886103 RepID=UPI002D1FD43D|nr:PEP-CTERM sorting domain-containing protein [Lyngbya sp. CCY1209]MEB3885566.1 PEP-CTERM sorting domain-containing protein [Lyngbya sp. CCY1209]
MKNRFLALAGALSILSTVAVAPKAQAQNIYPFLGFPPSVDGSTIDTSEPDSATVYAQAQGTPIQDVPEPMTMIGSAIAVGFGSLVLKKGNPKKSAK